MPVYPGAQADWTPYDAGSGMVTASWTVGGDLAGPEDWFKSHLQSGDFQLSVDQYSDPCGASYRFERRSDTHIGGFVAMVAGMAGPGKIMIIESIGPK